MPSLPYHPTLAEALAFVVGRLEERAGLLEVEWNRVRQRRLERLRRQRTLRSSHHQVQRLEERIRELWLRKAAILQAPDPAAQGERELAERRLLALCAKRERLRAMSVVLAPEDPPSARGIPSELRLRLWQLRLLVADDETWIAREEGWRWRLLSLVQQRRRDIVNLREAVARLTRLSVSLYAALERAGQDMPTTSRARLDRVRRLEDAMVTVTDIQVLVLSIRRRRWRLEVDWPELRALPALELAVLEGLHHDGPGGADDPVQGWERLREHIALGFRPGLPAGPAALSPRCIREHLATVRSLARSSHCLQSALRDPPLPVSEDQESALLALQRELARMVDALET